MKQGNQVVSAVLVMLSWLTFLHLPCLLPICHAEPAAQAGLPPVDVYLAAIITPIEPKGELRTVKAGKPEVIKPGSVFDLSCHRRNQNPGLFGSEPDGSGVSWMKDGRPFEDSRSSKIIGWLAGSEGIFHDYQIRFFNFSFADAGRYQCKTPQGEVNAQLAVKPVITPFPFAKIVTAGEPFKLTCEAKGYPEASTVWELPNGKVRRHSTLHLNASFPRHNGTFTCRSNNIAGNTVRKINVFVKDGLRFTSKPIQDIVISAGGAARLDCIAQGYPEPQYKWLAKYQGQAAYAVLSGKNGSSLTVTSAQQQLVGDYKCEVSSLFPCCANEEAAAQLTRTFRVTSEALTPAGPECTEAGCSGARGVHSTSSLLVTSMLLLLALLARV